MFQIKKDKKGGKKSKPKSTSNEEINSSSDSGNLPTPSPVKDDSPKTTKRKSGKKNNKKTDRDEAEINFVNRMDKTINTFEQIATQKAGQADNPTSSKNQSPEDEHDTWARLVASKVHRMNPLVLDDFKLEVDTLAVNYLKK